MKEGTWYAKNRDYALAKAKKYREENPEKIKEQQRLFFQNVRKARIAEGRRLWLLANPKPPKMPKNFKAPPKIKTTKTFLSKTPIPKNPKKVKPVFPDLSTLPDTPVVHPGPGLVEKKPGIFLDWNNL
jgi:hypothetical protein